MNCCCGRKCVDSSNHCRSCLEAIELGVLATDINEQLPVDDNDLLKNLDVPKSFDEKTLGLRKDSQESRVKGLTVPSHQVTEKQETQPDKNCRLFKCNNYYEGLENGRRDERERILQQLVYFQNAINSHIDASIDSDGVDENSLRDWIMDDFVVLREKIEKGLGGEK